MGEDIMFTRKSSPGISLVFILIKKLNILLYHFPGWDTSHTVKQDDSETVRISDVNSCLRRLCTNSISIQH